MVLDDAFYIAEFGTLRHKKTFDFYVSNIEYYHNRIDFSRYPTFFGELFVNIREKSYQLVIYILFAVRKTVCTYVSSIIFVFRTEQSIVEDTPMRTGENIYKRKDGRWEGRYQKRTPDGKSRYGYVYAPTYREAKARLQQAAVLWETNPPRERDDSLLLSSVARRWEENIAQKIKESSFAMGLVG